MGRTIDFIPRVLNNLNNLREGAKKQLVLMLVGVQTSVHTIHVCWIAAGPLGQVTIARVKTIELSHITSCTIESWNFTRKIDG